MVEEGVRESEGVEELTCVMKFGGSSVASAERMREVADLILSFPEERPIIVLSAMGKTTNKLITVSTILSLARIRDTCRSVCAVSRIVGFLLWVAKGHVTLTKKIC